MLPCLISCFLSPLQLVSLSSRDEAQRIQKPPSLSDQIPNPISVIAIFIAALFGSMRSLFRSTLLLPLANATALSRNES